MRRFNQRQGFLVSAAVHLTLLMILITTPPTPRKPDAIDPSTLERTKVVFLPPAAVLRRMLPSPPPSVRPAPPPPPATPDAQKKDRISIGPPTDLRTKGPLILRREDDLTKAPKGERMVPPATLAPKPSAPAAKAAASSPEMVQGSETPGREGLRLPPGFGRELSRGEEGQRARPGSLGSSIDQAVEVVARRLEKDARLGLPTGTGENLGGLYFDPQGADFTLWINHFKNEVYRNWIVPQAALLGFRGHVDFEFTVDRNGSMSALRLLKSSGTASFDRAAEHALTGSRFMSLPDDYGPPRVTMQVTFFYNEAPQGS